MTRVLSSSVLAAALFVGPAALGQDATPPATAPSTMSADADFEKSIERRAGETVEEMKVDDPAKAARVKETFKQHFRNIQAWHDAHGARRKELEKTLAKTPDDAAAKAEFDTLDAEMRQVHRTFIAAMEQDLKPEQLEMVKERLTGGRMAHNVRGYASEYPDLPESERAAVLKMLEDAREKAMPLGTSGEKDAVFSKVKGQINNYLSKKGFHDRKWAEKQKKAAQDAATAATQPAK